MYKLWRWLFSEPSPNPVLDAIERMYPPENANLIQELRNIQRQAGRLGKIMFIVTSLTLIVTSITPVVALLRYLQGLIKR